MKCELSSFAKERALGDVDVLLSSKKQIGDIAVSIGVVEANDMDEIRKIADMVLDRLVDGVVILAANHEGKVNLVAKASANAVAKGIHAGNIVKAAAKIVGGGGGGRKEMAQAGGKDPSKMSDALREAEKMIAEQIA